MEWLSSPLATLISLVFGLSGLALAIVFYFKQKRVKEPCWAVWTVNLFKDYSSTVEGLDVQYRGEKVKNLSISNVMFWNRGAETIHKSDISEVDPLRLELRGNGRILSATLLEMNNQASLPQITHPDGNRVHVSFDYMDRGQGFVMRVIHEGTSAGDLRLRGVLKGAAKIRGFNARPYEPSMKTVHLYRWLMLSVALFASMLTVINLKMFREHAPLLTIVLVVVVGLIYLLLGVLTFGSLFRLSWVPRGLESFRSDPIQVDDQVKT